MLWRVPSWAGRRAARSTWCATGGRRSLGTTTFGSGSSGPGHEPEPERMTPPSRVISIDTSGKFQASGLERAGMLRTFQPHPSKTPPTPLAVEIAARIKVRGPVTMSEYMNMCLQHPKYGYYMREGEKKLGLGGDFVTAPEISQLFGEMIGIWCCSWWEEMGRPPRVNLVEMGPGTGSLMSDILRSTKAFPDFRTAAHVHMVETSPDLSARQQAKMKAESAAAQWHTSLSTVPRGQPLLLIAQELLDALPVHQFQFTSRGWRERLVDVDESAEGSFHFRHVLSPHETPAIRAFLRDGSAPLQPGLNGDGGPVDGDGIEVSPAALAVVDEVARRIQADGGGALFMDYGEAHAQPETLRAFKAHEEVHLLDEPGLADITADVDFGTVKRVAEAIEGVRVHGPVPQGSFLINMGISQRAEALLEQEDVDDGAAQAIFDGYMRLVDPKQMGQKYKALALAGGRVPGSPPGF